MRRKAILAGLALAGVAAFGLVVAQQRTFVTIATGGTGGVYFIYGGGLASLLGKWLPGVEATAEATAASVDNMRLLEAKRATLAFSLADTAFDALKGQGRFTSAVPVRALAVLYNNYTHIVALDGSGINTVADLRGKRVSTGAAGSGTEIIAARVLEAAGMKLTDVRQERLGVAESAAALKDRKIDAFIWSGGIPTAAVVDLANTPGIKLKMINSSDLTAKLKRQYGSFYFNLRIPKDVYKTDADTNVIGVANILATRSDADVNLMYRITKAMFENRTELGAIHPEAKKLNLEDATDGSPVPFHIGAVRYFAEKGVKVK
jgi:uncharacterized protein